MNRRIAVLAAFALASVALLRAQTPVPPPSQLPTFRTGVDVVEVDVTVLDKDRRPVQGLTAADFTILERGKPQPIVAFSAIDVPPPVPASAAWVRDAAFDVVSNVENRRLVAIVMDDAYTASEPDNLRRARDIARTAVDELGPSDLAAVVFTFVGHPQNFTADRTRLLAAIDSFIPKSSGSAGSPLPCSPALQRACDVTTLSTVAATLLTAPPGRKVVILISGGRRLMEIGSQHDEAPELDQLFRDLQRANVTVYSFDAHGLQAAGTSASSATPVRQAIGFNESLHSFAASTGGRAFSNTNDPASHVSEAIRESSSYYLIGFQSTDPSADGRFRKLEVKANRPGVEVRTRNGYYAPKKTGAQPTDPTMNGLPGGDLPLHVSALPFAVPGRREAEVIVVARLEPSSAASDGLKVDLSATAIDMDSKPLGTERQTIAINPRAGRHAQPDLLSHLPLPPGRYMVRLAAESEGRTGTVFLDVEVPDVTKGPLSLSGLVLQLSPAVPVSDQAIADLIPVAPTTVREFDATDNVTVFLRVYQGGKDRVLPVRMVAKVTNERNSVSSNNEAVLEVGEFGGTRAADYRVALPVGHLAPGAYLLEVEAQVGARRVRRSARFTIVGAGSFRDSGRPRQRPNSW